MKIVANDYKANEIIKIIREWSGKTQEEFGKNINRTKNAIQFYEYGQRNYDFELLLTIAKKENLIITIEKKINHSIIILNLSISDTIFQK